MLKLHHTINTVKPQGLRTCVLIHGSRGCCCCCSLKSLLNTDPLPIEPGLWQALFLLSLSLFLSLTHQFSPPPPKNGLCLRGPHHLPADTQDMIDEQPRALESTLSAAHNLYILSLSEEKTEHGVWKWKHGPCLGFQYARHTNLKNFDCYLPSPSSGPKVSWPCAYSLYVSAFCARQLILDWQRLPQFSSKTSFGHVGVDVTTQLCLFHLQMKNTCCWEPFCWGFLSVKHL